MLTDNSMVRAMANTLCDWDVDPLNQAAVCVALIRAGFMVKDIEPIFNDVVLMTMIRQTNAKRGTEP